MLTTAVENKGKTHTDGSTETVCSSLSVVLSISLAAQTDSKSQTGDARIDCNLRSVWVTR